MSISATARAPFVGPNVGAAPQYVRTARDEKLLSFDNLRFWMRPDNGNVRTTGKNMRVQGVVGATAFSSDDAITLGTGMSGGAKPVIKLPGGTTTAPEQPLHVPGIEVENDSYFIATIVRWHASGLAASTAYTLFFSGVLGSTAANALQLNFFVLNNTLNLRHGGVTKATASVGMSVSTSYLLWASYDAVTETAMVGMNSVSPVAWADANVLDPAGNGREIVIGGNKNAGGTAGTQMFHGDLAEFFYFDTQLVTADKLALRQEIIAAIADGWGSDFTLV